MCRHKKLSTIVWTHIWYATLLFRDGRVAAWPQCVNRSPIWYAFCACKKDRVNLWLKISDTLRHGSPAPLVENRRMKVSPEKLYHFLTVITSQYVMQDLVRISWSCPPTPRSRFQMSWGPWFPTWLSNTTIAIAKRLALFLWTVLHPVGYLKYVWKSLQGLDYVSAEGAKAFEESGDVIQKLSDNPTAKASHGQKTRAELLVWAIFWHSICYITWSLLPYPEQIKMTSCKAIIYRLLT